MSPIFQKVYDLLLLRYKPGGAENNSDIVTL